MECKNDKVTDLECINCNECVNACPSKGAIFTGYSRKMALTPLLATLLALALFFTPIIIASATGSMQLLPNKYTNAQTEQEHEEAEEESSNTINGYSASDINGSKTMLEISDMLNIPLEELYSKLGLPDNYPQNNTIKTAALSQGIEFSVFKNKLFE